MSTSVSPLVTLDTDDPGTRLAHTVDVSGGGMLLVGADELATHVFEVITMLLALELIVGRRRIWLPQRWRRVELSGTALNRRVTVEVVGRALKPEPKPKVVKKK